MTPYIWTVIAICLVLAVIFYLAIETLELKLKKTIVIGDEQIMLFSPVKELSLILIASNLKSDNIYIARYSDVERLLRERVKDLKVDWRLICLTEDDQICAVDIRQGDRGELVGQVNILNNMVSFEDSLIVTKKLLVGNLETAA